MVRTAPGLTHWRTTPVIESIDPSANEPAPMSARHCVARNESAPCSWFARPADPLIGQPSPSLPERSRAVLPDARVEHGIEEIDGEVHDHIPDGHNGDRALERDVL